MMQAAAIFLDGYRELNARKMFWITLMLSGLALSVLLFIGITSDGKLTLFFWDTPIPLPPGFGLDKLLKGAFVSFGVSVWLTWAATILAIISTASIIPDFVTGGSIDLVLAKPVARLRLFLLKYLSGLMFVALQVAVFSLVGFIIIGVRTGVWEPALFLSVPLVVVFFSYLFCVCVLVGIITRSTIASLLATLLFWLGLFAVNLSDEYIMLPRVINELYVEKLQQRKERLEQDGNTNEAAMLKLQTQLGEAQESRDAWQKWHRMIVAAKTALPKTAETIKLLERRLIDLADLPEVEDDDNDAEMAFPFMSNEVRAAGVRVTDVSKRLEETYRNRSAAWVVGTSLMFEVAVLSLAAWVFCRRDF
jgi:hypothetical protein